MAWVYEASVSRGPGMPDVLKQPCSITAHLDYPAAVMYMTELCDKVQNVWTCLYGNMPSVRENFQDYMRRGRWPRENHLEKMWEKFVAETQQLKSFLQEWYMVHFDVWMYVAKTNNTLTWSRRDPSGLDVELIEDPEYALVTPYMNTRDTDNAVRNGIFVAIVRAMQARGIRTDQNMLRTFFFYTLMFAPEYTDMITDPDCPLGHSWYARPPLFMFKLQGRIPIVGLPALPEGPAHCFVDPVVGDLGRARAAPNNPILEFALTWYNGTTLYVQRGLDPVRPLLEDDVAVEDMPTYLRQVYHPLNG